MSAADRNAADYPESLEEADDPKAFARRQQYLTALHYAKLGFAVTPARFEPEGEGVPLVWPKSEKKPAVLWSKKAIDEGHSVGPTLDPDEIRSYFDTDLPTAICIHTGHFGNPRQLHIIAIDCDRRGQEHVRPDGTSEFVFVDGYRNLIDAVGGIENLGRPFVSVGRVNPSEASKPPGIHLIYRVDDQDPHALIRTLGGKLAPGVDLRGGRSSGGLVVESNGWHEKWRWLDHVPELDDDGNLLAKDGAVLDLDALPLPQFHENGENRSGLPLVFDAPDEMPQPLLDLVKLVSKIIQPPEADPRAVEALATAGLLDKAQRHRKVRPAALAAQQVRPAPSQDVPTQRKRDLPLPLATSCSCRACADFDEAKELLAHVPPEANYELWRNIIWAVSHMLDNSPCGRALVVEWSAASIVAKRNDPEQAASIYDDDQRFLDPDYAVPGMAIGKGVLTAVGRACGAPVGKGYPEPLLQQVVAEHAYTLGAECGLDLVAERARRLSAVFGQTHQTGTGIGYRDAEGHMILDHTRSLPTANAYIREHFLDADGERIALHYRNSFYRFDGAAYDLLPIDGIQAEVMRWLDEECYFWSSGNRPVKRRYGSRMKFVDDVVRSLRIALSTGADTLPPPFWIDRKTSAEGLLIGKTKVIDVRSGEAVAPSPRLFATNGVPWDPDPTAPRPREWINFLDSVFSGDPMSIALLQEWLGYVLLGSLAAQKMMCLIGVPASGKSTIGHVLKGLIGSSNYTGLDLGSLVRDKKPTLAAMSKKSLAVIADNRFAGHSGGVVETLLKIVGGDEVNFRGMRENDVTAVLPTRLMLMANALPELRDDAGAMRRRMLFLRFDVSFVGREDRSLLKRLNAEMPSILNWALEGARRLLDNDYEFTRPESTTAIEQEFEELASPLRAFVEECCILDSDQTVTCSDLRNAFCSWLRAQGYKQQDLPSPPEISKGLRSIGIPAASKQSGRPRYYRGIGLNDAAPL